MGLIVFLLLAGLEIALAVRNSAKNRLIIHAVQAAVVILAMLLPFGQKWRFVPVLGLLALLVLIALIRFILWKRKSGSDTKAGETELNAVESTAPATKAGRAKPKAGTIVSCVLCILLFGIFLMPAFIFTGYKGLPVTGDYKIEEASAILIDRSRTDPFEQDGSYREVPVHFYYPETDGSESSGDSAERYPLVIFSHGAFGYYQSNTSTYMELASNGYVVAALDHPHHAFFAEDTDGKTVIVDQGFLNDAMQASGEGLEENAQQSLDRSREWMALRTADMGFALDEIKRAAADGAPDDSWFFKDKDSSSAVISLLKMTDTAKIGLMGHSMGGATSVALGRERDDVTAVVDIDGTMLSEYTGIENGMLTVNEEPYEVPVLEFVNWEQYKELAEFLEEYRAKGGRYPNDELMRHAAAGFTTTVRDTKHMDFTDLPLLSPFLGKMLGSGERDKAETMTIVNDLVLHFYDCYLKGEGTFAVQDSY